ncbi:MAG: ribonuclease HII [Oscillospiraceae bacterium]|nr:ribonuclease HII [Oscillospiraceae bacterium]
MKDAALEFGLTVCGADEAGAGPLAGPVYAAAVILPPGCVIEGLDDSKKLTEKKREALFDVIVREAVSYAIASVDEKTIDGINILRARMLAMDKAIKALSPAPELELIDGNRTQGIEGNTLAVIGGDGIYSCIAAASVLAKVSRDRYMYALAEKYPQYAFDKHKGYGTKLHYERLAEFGPCPAHRLTFLKKKHG